MDANPNHPDDLKDVERRLSAWAPTPAGLDADAMLFDAGRASARPPRGRHVWPALACGLAVLSAVLGVWVRAERAERLALAEQVRRLTPAPAPPPAAPEEPSPSEAPSPSSVLAAHRVLAQGLDDWPVRVTALAPRPGTSPPEYPILQVGQRDVLLDP